MQDTVRMGMHLVPRDLPTDPVRIGWYNVPRDMLLNNDVRIGWFHVPRETWGGAGRPRITSPSSVSVQVNTPLTYQIAATNNPDSFNATGLPPGLSVNTTTGLISGTPTAVGNSTVTVSATNAEGTGSRNVQIRVTAAPPVPAGVAFYGPLTPSGTPTFLGPAPAMPDEALILALANTQANPAAGGAMTQVSTAGNFGVCFAYPASLPAPSTIINNSSSLDEKGIFRTDTVTVNSTPYQVWVLRNIAPFSVSGPPAGFTLTIGS